MSADGGNPGSSATLRVYLRSSLRSMHRDPLEAQREGCRVFATRDLPERFAIAVSWEGRQEYIDDASTQSAMVRHAALWLLLHELRPGDVVVMRDLARIGRDEEARQTTVRTMVEELGARLFVYETAEEVVPR
jgi:DNA invertase Pin-like site-specific DNA recombinase